MSFFWFAQDYEEMEICEKLKFIIVVMALFSRATKRATLERFSRQTCGGHLLDFHQHFKFTNVDELDMLSNGFSRAQ